MDFRAQYQDELEYLLEQGRAFASAHAQASHLAQRSGDPDVERLLEGFAFLSAKIHARLDEAQPALAQSLAQYLSPQHLRPVPACTMVEFAPSLRTQPDIIEIPAGSPLWSRAMQGEPARFETTQTLQLLPLRIVDATTKSLGGHKSQLFVEFETSTPGRKMLRDHGHLDFFIHGESAAATDLFMALARHCKKVTVHDYLGAPEDTRPKRNRIRRLNLGSPQLEAIGFSPQDPLLPWGDSCLISHRLLAEYQTLPEKFRQLRLHGLSGLVLRDNRFCLEFDLDCPSDVPGQVSEENFRLFCVPARNTFLAPAEPISMGVLDRPQRLRISGLDLTKVEVYDVTSVNRVSQGKSDHKRVPSFYEFQAGPAKSSQLRYSLERRTSPIDQHLDTYIRLHNHPKVDKNSTERLVVELLCTNRRMTQELKTGDINVSPGGASSQSSFRNIIPPTQPCAPPLNAELQWRLHASIALNRVSLTDASHLRTLFALYNHQDRLRTAQGLANRHLSQAIRSAKTASMTRVIDGAPVRGIESSVEIDQRHLSDGQAYLLGKLLDEVFAAHTSLNGVHETRIHLYPSGHQLRCRPRSGTRVL